MWLSLALVACLTCLSQARVPATGQQFVEYQRYISKYYDVQNAFNSGYRAALSAVQARSGIPSSPYGRRRRSLEEVARLNAAARHRNVYFDQMGGDPYSGASGVLTRQKMWLKKHK